MKKDKVDAGVYDRPIKIMQLSTVTDTGQGSGAENWVPYYSCMANIQSFARGRGLNKPLFAGQLYPEQGRMIAIRYQSSKPIDATMQVWHTRGGKTHVYQINGVDNYEEANVEIIMSCKELGAKGTN